MIVTRDLLSFFIRVMVIVLAVIWLTSAIVTVIDKRQARKNKRRVPEKTLLLLGLLGGALPMYVTMRAIHHKTLHKKFMIGLPLIMILHVILIAGFLWLLTKA